MDRLTEALIRSELTHAFLGTLQRGGNLCVCKGSRNIQVEVGGVSVIGHRGQGCPGPWVHNPRLLDEPKPLPCADACCNEVWKRERRESSR